MNKKTLNEIVKESQDAIKTEVKRRVIEGVQQDIVCQVREMVANSVKEFLDAEVYPELQAYLTSNKGPILKAAQDGADAVAGTLKTAMVEFLENKMKSEWNRNQVMQSLFK